MMKGINRPAFICIRLPDRTSARGRVLSTAPNAPPAPVMARMLAELVIPSLIQLKEVPFFSDLGIRVTARPTPRIRAVTGLPMKSKKAFAAPSPNGVDGKSATDFRAINTIGSKMGANERSAPGSFPYFSTSSSRETSGLAGISNLLEIFSA
ncbi:hypothetical protein SDC9_70667 [bioreactor metagenome]|uniref:Uncharacterized protein n=1 Tax=bioreactor metagenome TaxID=1076179 RepID=A0A644Y6K4_9ZZZZ